MEEKDMRYPPDLYCRCMDGPNYPDPNCVRCHGTGTPVPSFSLVMVTRTGLSSYPVKLFGTEDPFRYTRAGARARARNTGYYGSGVRPLCVVNVYPKAPKPDPNGPKLAGDDYTARIG